LIQSRMNNCHFWSTDFLYTEVQGSNSIFKKGA